MKLYARHWAGLAAASALLATSALADPLPAPTGSPSSITITPGLPTGASEVVKMYQGGINKDVLMRYVENSTQSFHLNADGIIYLQKLGLPQEVTSEMLRRDGELQKMQMASEWPASPPPGAQQAPPPAPMAQANTSVVMPSSPAPAVDPYPAMAPSTTIVYPDYSAYPYYYPYAGVGWGGWGWGRPYGYGYGWGWRGGVGFRGGWGGGGWHGGGGGHGGGGHH